MEKRRRVGRPTGQFDAQKERLLLILRCSPEFRTKTNSELGEALGVVRSQVTRYLEVLKKEGKISTDTSHHAWNEGANKKFRTKRTIVILEENNSAIL